MDIRDAITSKTTLISVMHANNEVGSIQPIAEISRIAHEAGVYLHTDAVQTVGHTPVDVNRLDVDILSVSAHKFYGPKGVGFLYARAGTRFEPFMHEERRRTDAGQALKTSPALLAWPKHWNWLQKISIARYSGKRHYVTGS
jgi:cysteine desulfurase